MPRYQDVYPSEALLRSFDVVRPRAGDLLSLEYFEAPPGSMPAEQFEQHHILLNLREAPQRVENWRGDAHRDFTFLHNEVVITPAGLRSGWRWHERSRVIVITIDPRRLGEFAHGQLGVVLSTRQLRDVPQQADADLVAAGVMLLDALKVRSSGSEVMYESLARIFLVKLIERYGEEHAASLAFSGGFNAQRYKRVLDYVAERFGAPITIEDLARVAGLSPAHFSRLFKEALGDSPYQFLMDYRIERAKQMLVDRERALIDIALTCGFSDQPHFSRVFKRLAGQTPKEYRSRNVQ